MKIVLYIGREAVVVRRSDCLTSTVSRQRCVDVWCVFVCVQWRHICRCCFTSWRCWSALVRCHCRRPLTASSSTSFTPSAPAHSLPSPVSPTAHYVHWGAL